MGSSGPTQRKSMFDQEPHLAGGGPLGYLQERVIMELWKQIQLVVDLSGPKAQANYLAMRSHRYLSSSSILP